MQLVFKRAVVRIPDFSAIGRRRARAIDMDAYDGIRTNAFCIIGSRFKVNVGITLACHINRHARVLLQGSFTVLGNGESERAFG